MSQQSTGVEPIVFERSGVVFANSRDVAFYFEKQHKHVLRDIDGLIRQGVSNFGEGAPKFGQGSYTLPETGQQQHRCYDMTRDGFTILAMGFTGQRALRFKLAYIDAFNRMEAELRERTQPALSINQKLRLVQEARRTFGQDAAQCMWREVGLPMPIAAANQSRNEPADRVYAAVARTGAATRREIYRQCRSMGVQRMEEVLGNLVRAGALMVETTRRPAGGWPLTVYRVVLQ